MEPGEGLDGWLLLLDQEQKGKAPGGQHRIATDRGGEAPHRKSLDESRNIDNTFDGSKGKTGEVHAIY